MIQENHPHNYDLAVIGAGPGGAEVARDVAKTGKKVALIEGDKLGGTCLNRGCIPAKTMLYMAEMYRELGKMKDYGINFDENSVKIDYEAMTKKRTEIMDKLRKGLKFQIERDHVEIKEAMATLVDAHTISLSNGETLTADHIVLASGGSARKFSGFKDDDPRYLTSDNIFELTEVPKSMAVVGAGPVGTEFASFFHTLGTKVYVIEKLDAFLGTYDEKLGAALIKEFDRDGIKCFPNTTIESIDDSGKSLSIQLSRNGTIEVDCILSAIGVEIQSDYLKDAGIALDRTGRVEVDDEFRSNIHNIYALGDLIGKSGSAYGAEREAKFIACLLLGMCDTSSVPVNYTYMPDVVFTSPEVATCGYSSDQLTKKGIHFTTKSVQFMINAKATIKGETRGTIWMYVEEKTERILGVHIIGHQATELIHLVPLVIANKMTLTDYKKMIWGHPVMAEVLKDVMVLG